MKVVHRSLREQESRDRALVLTAMDIEHELERGWVGWRIAVPPHEESRAQEQWRLYDLENTLARSSVARSGGADIAREGAAASTACWVVLLIVVYVLQSRHAFGIDWVGLGRLDVGAIRSGEWWRAITALTLHVDAPHLIANIGFGAVFGTLLGRAIGGGLAWFTILIGGTVGNLMNVAVQRPDHSAIGASTAVFAALGLYAAYLWTGRQLIRNSWARRVAPVVGAVFMLAWFGTGDERTDIVAHLTGFLAGFGVGALLGRILSPGEPAARTQWILGGSGIAVLAAAWGLALIFS
jgi:membrane associated rhomboid family serine protease